MSMPGKKGRTSQAGSVLVITVVLLGFAGLVIGSILTATMTYTHNSELVYARDKAAFLADAGLHAAVVRRNKEQSENVGYTNINFTDINYTESKTYFSKTAPFPFSDWGFQTQTSPTSGVIRSTGRYNGYIVTVQSVLTNEVFSDSAHAIYCLALYAGNSGGSSNYTLATGGTGNGADFVKGDAYSGGNFSNSGTAKLRLPEILVDTNSDGLASDGEKWTNAFAVNTYTNPLSLSAFNAYKASQSTNMSKSYSNGKYDYGEAFLDTIGNGLYEEGEPYTDSNGNGRHDEGDSFKDQNGNGVYNAGIDTVIDNGNGRYDAGEEWVEDSDPVRSLKRNNGKYDPAGGYWSGSTWTTARYRKNSSSPWIYPNTWPAEQYIDVGDGVFSPEEPYTDQNGLYDVGEQYVDDRNAVYDYGTMARKTLTGMPAPGPGQKANSGNNLPIDPPNLTNMYYNLPRSGAEPANALTRWGYDVLVNSNVFGTAKAITDTTKPQHIFVRNPPTSGSTTSAGKTINGRTYTRIRNASGAYLDDYFLEDPSDSFYNTSGDTSVEIDGTVYTAAQYLNVTAAGNNKLYFIDGNLYLHNPNAYAFRFHNPGTRITIVASGNITISDEFYYNADYAHGLVRTNVNSTIVNNPSDALCLIALKNPSSPTNTGNIFIGDAQFGTGGSIHALLYAENDFVDNNLNTSDQAFISIFGNMTAGNQIRLNRTVGSGQYRTRLDITLDERVRDLSINIPGLPHPIGSQYATPTRSLAWYLLPGTWSSFSFLQ